MILTKKHLPWTMSDQESSLPIFKLSSVSEVSESNKGFTTGFDYLRIFLALGVLLQHAARLSNANSYNWVNSNRYYWYFILPAFFSLSGYLVSGSLQRNSIINFLSLRAVRIFPALSVEVVLSATVLGISFTTLTIREYITRDEFYSYFLNVLGDIHYTLPGVFGGAQFNAQLWTIPYELKCYSILTAIYISIALLGYSRELLKMCILGLAAIGTFWMTINYSYAQTGLNVTGRALLLSFLWGCCIYFFAPKIPYSRAAATLFAIIGAYGLTIPETQYISVILVSYATVVFGNQKIAKIPFGDLSYGIYLFHYPILMTLSRGFLVTNFIFMAIFGILSSVIFALLSWNLVELPILKRKKLIISAVSKLEARLSGLVSEFR